MGSAGEVVHSPSAEKTHCLTDHPSSFLALLYFFHIDGMAFSLGEVCLVKCLKSNLSLVGNKSAVE